MVYPRVLRWLLLRRRAMQMQMHRFEEDRLIDSVGRLL